MSCKNHLSDTDIAPPSSPQSGTNNNSPPNYEDLSPLSSNYNVSQPIDDSRYDTPHYDDMQDNPLHFPPHELHNLNPRLQFKVSLVLLTQLTPFYFSPLVVIVLH